MKPKKPSSSVKQKNVSSLNFLSPKIGPKAVLSFLGSLIIMVALAGVSANLYQNKSQDLASSAAGKPQKISIDAYRGKKPTATKVPTLFISPTTNPIPSLIPTLPAVAGSPYLPFGPIQLPDSTFGNPFTGGYVGAGSVDKLNAMLPAARKAGARLIIKLPSSRTLFVNPDGTFNLTLWKQQIDRLRGFDFAPYVADGTVIGAELVNEPHDKSNWGGVPITKDQLEAAAAYAKSIWPTLPVGAGRSDYLKANALWRYLDFGNSQYHMRKGDINTWIATTVQESKDAGVGLLLSLNYSAGQLDNSPMTADQLNYYLSALVKDTYSCGLTGYYYDPTYMARPEIQSIMTSIAAQSKSHTAPPCYIGHVRN